MTHTEEQALRHVAIYGPCGEYRLETWEAVNGGLNWDLCRIGYRFTDPRGKVLFEGTDFKPSPLHGIDSDETLRALLTFFCLRPGDTDSEYFDGYTSEQLAFAQCFDAECIAATYTGEGHANLGGRLGTFVNIDGWEE